MANTAQITSDPAGRRGWMATASADLALTRNEVMLEALGGRTWIGAVNNLTGRPCTDVSVQVRFHDREFRPVGSPVSARTGWLSPGCGLHLQARLPRDAAGLRVHGLRWTAGGRTEVFGPGDPLTFGRLPD